MASLRTMRTLAFVAPLIAAACGGTVVGDGVDSGQDGTTTQDTGVVKTDSGFPIDTGTRDVVAKDTSTPPTDAGPGGIPCGASTCAPATQECCISTSTGTATCTATGSCDGGVPVACSGPEGCPKDEVCCANESGGGLGGVTVACTSMPCMGFTLCEKPGDCTPPDTCEASPIPGYSYCRRPRPDGGFHHDGGFGPPPDGGLLGDGGILPP